MRLVDTLELIRPHGEVAPRFCAAIVASTPRCGPAVHRGGSVLVSGFQQEQFIHIADSVLSDSSNNSPKGDDTWLGVTADVRRGRSIARHPWCVPGGSEHNIAVVHISGNDFKSKGSFVRQYLDRGFWAVFEQKMIRLREQTEDVFLVVWGDYELWARGFNDNVMDLTIRTKRPLLVATTARAQIWSLPPGSWASLTNGCAIVTLPPLNSLPTTGTLREALRKHCGDFWMPCWIRRSFISMLRTARSDRLHRGPR